MPTLTSIIIRIEMDKSQVSFGEVASAVTAAGGDMIAIDVIQAGQVTTVRDLTINIAEQNYRHILDRLGQLPGLKIQHVSDRTFLVHFGGKIRVQPTVPIKNREDLSRVYTPGVAKVCMAIHERPWEAYSLTIKRNTVAVITDGTAVLGLGDIGPHAALPVMEGKAMLFKQLADVDAFPICLDTKDTDEIVRMVKALSPGFGGINLEDISAPRCFEIERRLAEELDIPVFHDDQHGTAIVMMAGLWNALRIVGRRLEDARVVVVGIGAAGVSCCNMLLAGGVKDLIAVDRDGILHRGHVYENQVWNQLAARTNPRGVQGGLAEALEGADVFIGVSGPGVLKLHDLQRMSGDRIVFAMANPEPEIHPEEAMPHVRVLATGRSDYPNQINNVLCFPGIFRGALDCRAREINEEMKLAASRAIASVISAEELNENYIIPSLFNAQVVESVRHAVVQAAIETGTARKVPKEYRRMGTSLSGHSAPAAQERSEEP